MADKAEKNFSLDDYIKILTKGKLNIEVIYCVDDADVAHFFVRGRPYGAKAPKVAMVIGAGPDLRTALAKTVEALQAGQFVALDWTYRPGSYYTQATMSEAAKPQKPSLPKAGAFGYADDLPV